MAARIEIYRTDVGEYAFRLLTKTGELVAVGEPRRTRAVVRQDVAAMLKAISKAKVYDLTDISPVP